MQKFIFWWYSSSFLGFRIKTSSVPLITVNGVLNSCEASEVNCFSLSIVFSIRSNKLLMVVESVYNSSLFFGNNTKNFRDKNNYFAFTEERRILRINFDTNTYDTFQNEAFSTKIFERFQPVVENDILYYFNHNHATVSIDLLAVPLADFLGEPQSSATFLETDYWEEYGMLFISGLVLFLISLLIYFLLLLNPKKANYITDKDGILYLGKAAINFEETELIVLKYLLKNNDVPNSELLGLVEQKGVHFSHNIRMKNDLLSQLNLKLKAILQVDVNFIIFKKSDTDSRLKVYRLNKQYFRVSEAFLNS